MMYAKYAFAVVMAAVAVRAEDDEVVSVKSNCCDSVATCDSCAHSSSFRKCGVPSSCCFESSCCPSDKKAFEERYTGENAVEFVRFYPEELVIDGKAATSTDFAQVAGKTPEDPKVDFAFLKRTGAFVVGKAPTSATREGETAGQELPEGAIITGWQSKTGSYLLDAPKEDATTLDFTAKTAKTVIGFWVKSSSMKKAAAVGKSHAEGEDANVATNTDEATDKDVVTNTDPKEGENKEGEEGAKSNMLWIIIAGVVAVVIVVGIIAYFVLAGGDDAEEEEEETDEEAAEEA